MLAQTEKEAQRFQALGVPCALVGGALKFDRDIQPQVLQEAVKLRETWQRQQVWVAASVHMDELDILMTVHERVRQALPQALLVMVPRYPEQFERFAAALTAAKTPYQRYTDAALFSPNTSVYLVDTMGELMMCYAASDVALWGAA